MTSKLKSVFYPFYASRVYPFGLILIMYVSLSLYQINLPGLHYDEAFEAVPALQLLLGQPVTAFRGSILTLGQHNFPLMTQDYIGALNAYTAMPFIAVFGATPAALRTMSIVIGAITLGLTYALAGRLTGQVWVGLTAALLLSVDPTFIFWNRQGVFVTAITATIGLAATYCWLRRFQGRSIYWSVAGAFFLGLGIYAKFLFLWLIVALAGSAILVNVKWFTNCKTAMIDTIKRLSPVEIITSLLAFLLGCSPLIVYNLQTGGTVLSITQNASTSYYGVSNLAIGANLVERSRQFITMLSGRHLWYLGDIIENFSPSAVFGLIVFGVIYLATRIYSPAIKNTRLPPLKVALFPLFVIGLTILISIGTVSALWITHFAILMPWPALAIALGSWFILINCASAKLKSTVNFFILAGLGALVVTNLASTIRYHAALTKSGGLSSHSDAIYDMSHWLAQHATGPVIAMDWGLAAPVTYLTHGRITATEVFGYEWQSDVQLTERLEWSMAQPDTFYLWRSPDEVIFDRSPEFKALYRPKSLEENIEEAFYEKSGRPILGVTRLVERGQANNPPQ
jgi:hypothetical protein